MHSSGVGAMGEYFAWANIDKRERLKMGAFSGSIEAVAPYWVGNYDIDAVCTLLMGRWEGDTIAYLGDESTDYWPDRSQKALAYRKNESPVFLDYAEDHFMDITGLFKHAEGMTYHVYTDTEDLEVSYEGPFELDIEHVRYVINHTKRLFYDRQKTPIRCVWPHGLGISDKVVRFDPFPALFTKDSRLRSFNVHANRAFETDWVGDVVEPSNERLPDGYLDVSAFYNYWEPSLIADDETVLAAIEGDRYKSLVASGVKGIDALKRTLPEHVIRGPIKEPSGWPFLPTKIHDRLQGMGR